MYTSYAGVVNITNLSINRQLKVFRRHQHSSLLQTPTTFRLLLLSKYASKGLVYGIAFNPTQHVDLWLGVGRYISLSEN